MSSCPGDGNAQRAESEILPARQDIRSKIFLFLAGFGETSPARLKHLSQQVFPDRVYRQSHLGQNKRVRRSLVDIRHVPIKYLSILLDQNFDVARDFASVRSQFNTFNFRHLKPPKTDALPVHGAEAPWGRLTRAMLWKGQGPRQARKLRNRRPERLSRWRSARSPTRHGSPRNGRGFRRSVGKAPATAPRAPPPA